MHIKRIIICGFKSYKKKVVLDLSPGHNVVVGSNGSGKSNIYAALEFVLSSKYDLLRTEQRKQLLHDAGQSGVVSAFVEVIFDNADGRFPINESLVSIKRTIGAKKDEYFVNQKHTTNRELSSLLESAGISKQNQHFIVPQGQIAQRVKERDNERLKLLKEIAGTRIYDSKRGESRNLMVQADSKRTKVRMVIEYFTERLDELRAEKEELAQFHVLETKRRSVEYHIFDDEKQQTQEALHALEESESRTDQRNEELHSTLKAIQSEIEQLRGESTEGAANNERRQRELLRKRKELRSMERAIVGLESKVKSLQKDRDEYSGKRELYQQELEEVKARISGIRKELAAVSSEFEAKKSEDDERRQQMNANTSALEGLYAKRERLGQFKSKKERNASLQRQVDEMRSELAEQEKLCKAVTKDSDALDERLTALSKEMRSLQREQKATERALREREQNRKTLKENRAKLVNERKKLWKERHELNQRRDQLKPRREEKEKLFRFTMSLGMWKSYCALKRIQKDIEENGEQSRYKLPGKLYGAVIENFRTKQARYDLAVEAAAGNKLFYYLVENDATAAALIEIMQRERINRVTFIPLNQCGADRQRPRKYPKGSADVIPMMRLLKWDRDIVNLEGALMQIFGNTLIPQDLDIGHEYAMREGFQCVTLSGDIVTARGAIDGGFNEGKYRRLKCFTAIRDLDQEVVDCNERAAANEDAVKHLQQRLLETDNALRANEQETAKSEMAMNQHQERALEVEEEIEIADRGKAQKASILEKHEANIQRMRDTVNQLESEMKQALKRKLSADERRTIDRLVADNERITKEVAAAVEALSAAETTKFNMESVLRDNLLPQQKELMSKIKKCAETASTEQTLDTTSLRLTAERERQSKMAEEIEADEAAVEEWASRSKTVEKQLAKRSKREQAVLLEIEEHSVDAQNVVGRRQALMEKIELYAKYIHELGALDNATVAKYARKSTESLKKSLKKIKKDLEQFGNINKKALDQFTSFSKEKEKLERQNSTQLVDKEHIESLMDHLDLKKDDAITRTFHAINKEFKEAFRSLVMRGSAKLMLFEHKEGASGGAAEDDLTQSTQSQSQRGDGRRRRRRRSSNVRNRRKSSMASGSLYDDEVEDKKYAGVGIRVSFGKDNVDRDGADSEEEDGKESDRARDMTQLSGGQQTVVALALIFAIQRCDPSPFYVFDEIDAALDQQYRKAVADLMAQQKSNTQFITTTFRPEILAEADKAFVVDFKAKISTVREMDPREVDMTKFL